LEADMADEAQTEQPTIEVVYLGARCTHDQKAHAGFITVEEAQRLSERGNELAPAFALALKRCSYFVDSKETRRMVVGAIYRATGTSEGGRIKTLAVSGAKFTGRRYADSAMLMDAEFADRAARGEIAGLARLAKMKKEPAMLDELRGLRRAYQGTNGAGRVAMEIAILAALRTPVRL
jgi:hypothetical protein